MGTHKNKPLEKRLHVKNMHSYIKIDQTNDEQRKPHALQVYYRQGLVVGINKTVVDGDPSILYDSLQAQAVRAEQLIREKSVPDVNFHQQRLIFL